MTNFIIAHLSSVSPARILLLAIVLYLTWRLSLIIQKQVRLAYWHRKIPGGGCRSIVAKIVGAPLFDYLQYNEDMPKLFTRIILGMNVIDSASKLGITRVRFGFQRYVNLFRVDTVEALATSMDNISKSDQYNYFQPWLGFGLLTSSGNLWRRHRKLLTPAFHFTILESFMPIMNENAHKLVHRIAQSQDNTMDIRAMVADCTLDIICETAMGVSIGAQSGNVQYAQPLSTVQSLIINRTLNPWLQSDFVYSLTTFGKSYRRNLSTINRFIGKVITDRREEFQERAVDVHTVGSEQLGVLSRKRYSFLDSLLVTHLQNATDFTEKDILDEVNTFMFEGHDTTSIGLIFTLLLVATDQRVQNNIYEELKTILTNDVNRPITVDDCRQMKYLEMVIKEGLRLYPPVPFIGRQIERDFKVKDYLIPAGCSCLIYIYLLNRDPSVFPQPERFVPERFGPDSPLHRMPFPTCLSVQDLAIALDKSLHCSR